MRNNILTVVRKECRRVFTDKGLFFSTVILPGLMIFLSYTIMGQVIPLLGGIDDDYVFQVHVVNMPGFVGERLAGLGDGIEFLPAGEQDVERLRGEVERQETDLLVVFPEGLAEFVGGFEPSAVYGAVPNVQVWFNSVRTESGSARRMVESVLTGYLQAYAPFTVNAPDADEPHGAFDTATAEDFLSEIVGTALPLMLMIFLFSAAMTLAPETVAGEKERGTLAGMLVTPASRRDLALGKIISISIFCVMSATLTIAGVMASFPALMGIAGGTGAVFEVFGIGEMLLTLLVAASTSLVFVGMLAILSALAKTVKEAQGYSYPFLFVIIGLGLASMAFDGAPESVWFYFVPVLSSSLSFAAVLGSEPVALNLAVTFAGNVLFAVALSFALAKMFDSERIVFDK